MTDVSRRVANRVARGLLRPFLGLAGAIALCGGLAAQVADTPLPADAQRDVVLRAMIDELMRTRQLSMISGAPLYYVNYLYAKGDSFAVTASLGALVSKGESQMRAPTVNVRVGNPNLDDTNFVASGVYQGTRYNVDRFPLDDNYAAMRRNWWLLTDMRYKSAVQSLNLKRASQQNVQAGAVMPDFTKGEATRLFPPLSTPQFDKDRWERLVRSFSKEFSRYPDILESQVQFGYTRGTEYIVNSEGSIVRRPFAMAHLRAVGAAKAADHTTIWDHVEYLGMREEDFPSEDAIRKDIGAMMERLNSARTAPVAESYRGPVLFEGQAASQLVAQLIGRQLWIPRKPVMLPNRPLNWPRVELEGRLGMTVVSEKLTVRDDPTMKSFGDQRLIGYTETDLEAVVPKPLTVIRNGKLEDLFRTRTPSQPGETTNGRARIPGIFGANRGAPTNLIVEASDTMPEDSLKQRLIEMITVAGMSYGMLVRKLDFPTSASQDSLRRLTASATASSGRVRVSIPLALYRVYPDGREELLRGMNFRDLELRALRDVAAAGDRQHLFQYLENGALFAQMGTGGYVAECSVIAPSLLLEEVELEPITGDTPTPPVVDPPALSAAN